LNPSRVVSSAIWAAYGDALGFITEFRDANGVKRKFSGEGVTRPLAWERRVGGKFGPTVELPAGCYSDDTQLRLATSRAIRGDGTFDVEAFAKVELPVWLAYHLGAGRGTKAAARNLERKDVTWYSNFFVDDGTNYVHSGGNGAAMRIQPHVWSEPRERKGTSALALNVFRNAITTHGHPRGFLGALFHAQCLSMAVRDGRIADPNAWMRFTDSFEQVTELVSSDEHLDRVWRPTWEQQSRQSLRDAIQTVQGEHREDIKVAAERLFGRSHPREEYHEILREIGGLKKETMGSGTKSALLAAVLSYLCRDIGVEEAIVVASNELGSDTDTIATMTGALLGSISTVAPKIAPQDSEYLIREAERLAGISEGVHGPSFRYPDLLYWRAPKTQLDAVGSVNGGVGVAGLGPASPAGRLAKAPKQQNVGWEWLQLSFGQTVLAKRRAKLAPLPPSTMPQQPSEPRRPKAEVKPLRPEMRSQPSQPEPRDRGVQQNLFDRPTKQGQQTSGQKSIDRLTDDAIRSGFHPVSVGKNFIDLIDKSLTPIEDAIAYAAILAKARVARLRGRPKADDSSTDREGGI
jgi:ADP-ribosylglycohydrolase